MTCYITNRELSTEIRLAPRTVGGPVAFLIQAPASRVFPVTFKEAIGLFDGSRA
jgi:hypothetical protein